MLTSRLLQRSLNALYSADEVSVPGLYDLVSGTERKEPSLNALLGKQGRGQVLMAFVIGLTVTQLFQLETSTNSVDIVISWQAARERLQTECELMHEGVAVILVTSL